MPAMVVYASAQGRDFGARTDDIQKIVAETAKRLPKDASVTLSGQALTMNAVFRELLFGLVGAVLLIDLIVVLNFQSWLDPTGIFSTLRVAAAGLVWILFAASNTLSVSALTCSIIYLGVATANSILVVGFGRERLIVLGDSMQATLGEGGEQNAPLGRAVIGGSVFAAFATLLFAPAVFALVHRHSSHARLVADHHPSNP